MKKLIHLSMLVVLILQSFFPAIDAMAKEAGQAALISQEQAGLQQDSTITPQDESTPELTPTPSVETTVTPTETLSVTTTPTETPVVTVTPTGTPLPPTPKMSATPIPGQTGNTQLSGEQYEILLVANPGFINPGGQFNLQWQIVSGGDLEGLDLVFMLPDEVTLREIINQEVTDAYRIPAEEKGMLSFNVGTNAEMPVLIQVLLLPQETGTDRMAYLAAEPLAQGQIALVEKLEVQKTGGKVAGLNGKVKVTFPEKALSESAEVFIHRPLPESMPPQSLSGKPFEITAKQKSNGAEMKKFGDGIKIEVDYSDLEIEPRDEANLYLYWYDPELKEWLALPSFVDPQTKTLRATTTHFTTFDVGVNDWDASRTPSIENFQVSEFTGAASYSLPIEVLPGPGGFQPSLSLSYNSQVVDQSTLVTQASWVGMGWSLDVGSISLDDKGTTDWTEDDTYFLSVAGVSTRLLRGPDGQFHMEDDNFWKISFDEPNNIWKVWDTTGNRYTFSAVTRMGFAQGCYNADHGGGVKYMTYQWQLTEMENIHGQKISYAYEKETKDIPGETYINANGRCEARTYPIDTAIYLKSISYPGLNNPYKIEFELDERNDFPAGWKTDAAPHQYQGSRLSLIKILNGSTVVRKYELLYAESSGWIFPGFNHRTDDSGKMSTLRAVREYGLNDASLPLTVFTYDGLHLVKGENGYGGRVEFSYTPYVEYAGTDENSVVEYDFGTTGNCPAITASTTEYWYIASGGAIPDCNVPDPGIIISGKIHNWNIKSENDTYPIRPGGTYRLTAKATNLQSGARWRIGASDYIQTIESAWSTGSGEIQHTFTMSPSGQWLSINGESDGWNVTLTNFKLEALPTFYRVQTKELYAAADAAPYTFTYTYSYPHMNDPLRSEAVQSCPPDSTTCKQYVEQYSEFRGHGVVQVADPYGKVIKTYYEQSDKFKGKPTRVEVWAGTKLISSSHNTYAVQSLDPGVLLSTEMIQYIGVWRAFIYTQSDEQRTYNNTGTQVASIMREYDYGPNIIADYGNLKEIREKKKENADENAPFQLYRRTEYFYSPPNLVNRYLVSLPSKQKVYDQAGNELAVTIYLYDGNQGHHQVTPTNGKLTTVRTRASGNDYIQVDYGYDVWGNQTSITNYSQYGTWETNPTGGARITLTQYDSTYHTYPTKITNALQHSTEFLDYDFNLGQPKKLKDLNGAETTATYDDFGRMKTLTKPDSGVMNSIKIDYVSTNPFKVTFTMQVDADKTYVEERNYDGMGRVKETISNTFASQATYDAYGKVLTSNVPGYASAVTTNAYDEVGRLTSVTSPDGTKILYTYDGLTTTVRDDKMRDTISTSNALGQTVKVKPAIGPVVGYLYHPSGQLAKVIRATEAEVDACLTNPSTSCQSDSVVELAYDLAGRKIYMDDPDMGKWYYRYDALGNLISQVDAEKQAINLYYDALSRLVGKTYASNVSDPATYQPPINLDATTYTVRYFYDTGLYGQYIPNGIGRRTAMSTSGSTSTEWAHDPRGRVLTETQTILNETFTTQWTYNYADLPVTITYPDQEKVTQTYDNRMLVKSLQKTSGPRDAMEFYVYSTDYDSAGRMTQRTYGNGTRTDYTYNNWNLNGGRLAGITTAKGSAGNTLTLQSLSYGYDSVGNVISIHSQSAGESQGFEYDALDRLTTWKLGAYLLANLPVQETYAYDAQGRLTNQAGQQNLYENDQLHSVSSLKVGGQTVGQFTYDLNGNMESRSLDGASIELEYDHENRLVQVNMNGTLQPSATPQASPTPVVATSTPTLSPTVTTTPTKTPTNTATPTKTKTPTPTATPSPVFSDVSNTSIYRPYIETLYRAGIVGGCATGPLRYCPSDGVTRAQMAVFLLKSKYGPSYPVPAVGATTGFNDVPTTHWAAAWIKQLAAEGITSGCGSGNYCPEQFVTREQFAIFVLKTNGVMSVPTYTTFSYTDIGSSFARHWIQYLASVRGITDNCAPGNYCPLGTLTRERIAFLLVRVFNMPLTSLPPSLAEVDSAEDLPAPVGAKVLASPLQTFTKTISFVYNADGQRVAQTINGVTTYFVGGHYEKTGAVVTKYYFAGSQRVAMRKNGVLSYFVNDHLGSTSLMTDASGNVTAEIRYTPWGKERYNSGALPTNYTYTGQYSNANDFGLMYYNARWYDPYITQFSQPDTIITNPGNSLDWNRYSYARNNPVRYNDPSGHTPNCGPDGVWCSNDFEEAYGISFEGDWTLHQNGAKVRVAVRAVARRLASEMGLDNPAMAFSLVYGAVHFRMGNCDACNGSGGFAYGYQKREGHHLIAFESITAMSSTQPNAFMRGVKNVVHELGHIYNNIFDKDPSKALDGESIALRNNRNLFLRPNLDSTGGACPLCLDWQQHPPEFSSNGSGGSETFADMFVAWTFNAWNTNTNVDNVLAVSQAQTWMSQWP